MSSFDWDRFDRLVARPPDDLIRRLARHVLRSVQPISTGSSAFPRAEADLIAALGALLPADDWYGGKTPAEARIVDEIAVELFLRTKPNPMRIQPLSDGVSFDVVGIATGEFVLDDARNEPRNRSACITRSETPWDESTELAALGCRPVRYPSWDRKATQEQWKIHNPFIEGQDAVHQPEYSVHPPDRVERIRQDLALVGEDFRRTLGRVKSKRARDAALANFEDDLVAPIEKAAADGRAVFACWDH
jgi:hypothetical protein